MIDRAPCEMFGEQSRIDAVGKIDDAGEMAVIYPLGATERQADAVQRYRVVGPHRLQYGQRGAVQIVVAVDLDPSDRGAGFKQRRVMRIA